MGRGTLASEYVASALEAPGRRMAEAVAAGAFDVARALTEEAIRLRAESLVSDR
jgi:hypothetical protein